MSAAHERSTSPYDLIMPRDPDYDNERPQRRRRLVSPLEEEDIRPHRAVHYPGDGLDFRRPIMSGSAAASRLRDAHGINVGGNSQATAIDLTDDDGMENSRAGERSQPGPAGAASSSRAQRLPRFGRNLLELDSSPEPEYNADEIRNTAQLPGASYLALPPGHNLSTSPQPLRRPQYSMLRRPARPPSPPTVMDEDEIEFVRERPRTSRQPTPAVNLPPPRSGPRSVTPYPTGITDNVIDLTAENDDDVVLVNSRQRYGGNNDNGANVAEPQFPAAGMNFGHIGHIAALVRDGGLDYGGRLFQRVRAGFGIDALDGEHRAAQQIGDMMAHNRHRQEHQGLHAVARAARLERERSAGAAARGRHAVPLPPGLRRGLPGIMDYGAAAFDLGLPGGHRPPTPKYSPPASPGPGFTRSPEEDEVVVCPNCGDELAMGDGDTKQEVWIVKSCGHVSLLQIQRNIISPHANDHPD